MSLQFKSSFQLIGNLLAEHPEMVAELSKRLHLTYVDEKDSECNVCFLESEEVTPAFRQIFTRADVLHFVYAQSKHTSSVDSVNEKFEFDFSFPRDAEEFWRLVEEGKRLSTE